MEDSQLSEIGVDFADALIEFISTNDIATSSDIINYIEEYFEK
jgi:hypothetical protein